MQMNNRTQKAGIVCCSDGQKKEWAGKLRILETALSDMGIQPVCSDFIFERENVFSGTAKERADALMGFYRDSEIAEIFDISGGDAANGILPYLDYECIKNSGKRFWGYSDLTTVINAIYAKTGRSGVLYQIRNLIYDDKEQQIHDFKNTVVEQGRDLFLLNYRFIQQEQMQGIVVGGNIRCFLKLAGTEYMPDLEGRILLLESQSGSVSRIKSFLCQLQQMGAFEKVAGVLLGTFTQLEQETGAQTAGRLVKKIAGKSLPVAVTADIGHGTDAKAVVIGEEMRFGSGQGAGCSVM